MLSKVVSKEEALSKIHDGQTIMFGDWHGDLSAEEIITGLVLPCFFNVSSSVEVKPKFPFINSDASWGRFTPARLKTKSACLQ